LSFAIGKPALANARLNVGCGECVVCSKNEDDDEFCAHGNPWSALFGALF
jgi:hypothetical protein